MNRNLNDPQCGVSPKTQKVPDSEKLTLGQAAKNLSNGMIYVSAGERAILSWLSPGPEHPVDDIAGDAKDLAPQLAAAQRKKAIGSARSVWENRSHQ